MSNVPGDMSALHELYENWVAAGEDWRKTKVYVKMTNSQGNIENESKGWLSVQELENKLGSTAAKAMIDHLEVKKPDQCRYHPDAPGIKDIASLYDVSIDTYSHVQYVNMPWAMKFECTMHYRYEYPASQFFAGVPTVQSPDPRSRGQAQRELGSENHGDE